MFNKLVEEAMEGNKFATEEIINRLQPLIISSIRRYYNNIKEYEDLIQEGNLMVVESLRNFDKDRGVHFLGYIKSNLRFLYLNKHKEKVHLSLNEPLGDDQMEAIDFIVSNDKEAIEAILEKERNQDLEMALEKLTERQREVVTLFYLTNLSIDEISIRLGITYRTVVNLKVKALDNLKKWIR